MPTIWTDKEHELLIDLLKSKTPASAIAKQLGRSVIAVKCKIYDIRNGKDLMPKPPPPPPLDPMFVADFLTSSWGLPDARQRLDS